MTSTYTDIIYEKGDGIAKITINRPEVLNAFRPRTIDEMVDAFKDAWFDEKVGVAVLTGVGDRAFCSGGDQRLKGPGGYRDDSGSTRMQVLELHRTMRSIPKPVIAMVNGYAIGGGHVLHVLCDLTIASETAIFGQTGPKVGSFDGGFGAVYLANIIGEKKAREFWFMCQQYTAREAEAMGLVNKVVPPEELGSRDGALVQRDAEEEPDGTQDAQGFLQRGDRLGLWPAGGGARCEQPLLRFGGGIGGEQRVSGETTTGLFAVQAYALVAGW